MAFVFPGKGGRLSLSLRFSVFLMVFAWSIMLIAALVLFSTGQFSLGLKENQILLENELDHIAGGLETGLGTLSVESIILSQRLTEAIERDLSSRSLSWEEFKAAPEFIEPVLRSLMDILVTALEKNVASSVYVALDTTVNPSAPGAKNSRAGVVIQNSESNALNRASPSLHYLKGPHALGREWRLYMRPQWTYEFTVSPGDFWHETMKFAQVNMDISRLYYWAPVHVAEGDYHKVLRIAVPLRSSEGTVLGVCGFDISELLFKLQNVPNTAAQQVFSILGPVDGLRFDGEHSLTASHQGSSFKLPGTLYIEEKNDSLSVFTGSDGVRFAGLWRPVKMYPGDAVHGGQRWAAAIMTPKNDLDRYAARKNRNIIVLLSLLLLVSIAITIPLSRKYLAPVYRAIGLIKEKSFAEYEKTNIPEIDDLFEFLAEQDRLASQNESPAGVSRRKEQSALENTALAARFDEFRKNLASLSKAERSVFNLYAKNNSAKEIASMLCISLNTIKTHNRHIFAKLGVTSRKEIMVYMDMMNTDGQRLP
jgi:DNA-binding CsgD family transcriptional regulator